MDINKFVIEFAELLEDVDTSRITAATKFKDFDAWDSLTALEVVSMIQINYGVLLSAGPSLWSRKIWKKPATR